MRRKNIIKILFILSLALLSFCPLAPADAAAASLYLSPSTGTYVIEGNLAVAVKVDTGGEVINAAEGTISFDKNLLQVVSLSESSSIFSMWIVKPTFSNENGTVSFSGGLPKPAYKGAAGHLFTINFRAKKAGQAQTRFSSGAVLVNNESGTNILASMGSASFIISPKVASPNPADAAAQSLASTSLEEKSGDSYLEPIVTSQSHPDQNKWAKENNVKFSWKLPQGIAALSYDFNKEPIADLKIESPALITEKEYQKTEDGIWYFHLKFKDSQKWGVVAHYRVMIDTEPPIINNIKVNQLQVGEWPVLNFEGSDSKSGIKKYELIVGSLENNSFEIASQENSFKLANLEAGEHTALIKAIDNADNVAYSELIFTIEPIESPKILNYPQELKSADKFYISGTALPNVDIEVFLQKGDKLISHEKAKSDSGGNWFLVSSISLENDRYAAFAKAINANGVKSLPSSSVTFLVTPPVFARVGSWVINYFTVFVSLLFMIILIVVLIFYLINIARRKLKKETVEVEEVLVKHLANLKASVDEEFNNLNKVAGTTYFKKEGIRSKARLKAGIEEIEKKIGKEVKDVEELLK